MYVKRLQIEGKPGVNFKGEVDDGSFTAYVLPQGPASGDPLVTLGDNNGLAEVQAIYARWQPYQDVTVVAITVRFIHGGAKRGGGGLNGVLAVNLGLEGATEYDLTCI